MVVWGATLGRLVQLMLLKEVREQSRQKGDDNRSSEESVSDRRRDSHQGTSSVGKLAVMLLELVKMCSEAASIR